VRQITAEESRRALASNEVTPSDYGPDGCLWPNVAGATS
jgi:hypothetical protein